MSVMAFAATDAVGVAIETTVDEPLCCAEAIESIAAAAKADTNLVEIMMEVVKMAAKWMGKL